MPEKSVNGKNICNNDDDDDTQLVLKFTVTLYKMWQKFGAVIIGVQFSICGAITLQCINNI